MKLNNILGTDNAKNTVNSAMENFIMKVLLFSLMKLYITSGVDDISRYDTATTDR
jgi:hypothetical protein